MKARKELFEKAVKLLAMHPAFSGAKEEALRYILASEDAVLKDFSKGQQVFPCHGIKKAVGVILTGGCHLLEGGRITASKPDGFVFGAETLYSSLAEGFTLSASQDSKVIFIKKSAVDRLLQDDFSASRGFLEYLSEKETAEKNRESQKSGAESKLAAYLLERPKNAKNEVSLPQDMLKVAKSLSLTKGGLYRALKELNNSGAIDFSGTAICIKSEDLLKKFI
ncbi:MAG: Crp/Fnr family transcriptional regulator [Clostridia bacterium]|nr:Crp/Fnr family transcriptional regulator [Clostridia bacterium]